MCEYVLVCFKELDVSVHPPRMLVRISTERLKCFMMLYDCVWIQSLVMSNKDRHIGIHEGVQNLLLLALPGPSKVPKKIRLY